VKGSKIWGISLLSSNIYCSLCGYVCCLCHVIETDGLKWLKGKGVVLCRVGIVGPSIQFRWLKRPTHSNLWCHCWASAQTEGGEGSCYCVSYVYDVNQRW
jgi:hypothetical protein